MVGDQFDQRRGSETPKESPFTDAVRERYQMPEGQDGRAELRIDQLNPDQRMLVGQVLTELKACLTKVDDALNAVERERANTPDYQRENFDQWRETFRQNQLLEARRGINEPAEKLPCRLAIDVQCYGPPGGFQPETFKITLPANPADITLLGSNTAFKVHSDNPVRNQDLSADNGPDKFVSGWEVVFQMSRKLAAQESRSA